MKTFHSVDWEFCCFLLPKVSRTFALNISFLTGDLHKAVLCSYLFCRILDTIEDSSRLTPAKKIEALNLWASFFPFQKNWEQLLEKFCTYGAVGEADLTDNPYETELLRNSKKVFAVFSTLDSSVHDAITPWVIEMAQGMAEYQNRAISGIPTCLQSLEDLDRYCYFVAGTVGKLLMSLLEIFIPSLSPEKKLILRNNAVSFGLGLQMTNILKDIHDDQQRDWCFIPESLMTQAGLTFETFLLSENQEKANGILDALIGVAAQHLDHALIYSLAIPRTERRVRLFCLLPLHFAIETLALLKTHKKDTKMKISRQSVYRTLLFTQSTFFSNTLQARFYKHFRKSIA